MGTIRADLASEGFEGFGWVGLAGASSGASCASQPGLYWTAMMKDPCVMQGPVLRHLNAISDTFDRLA